MGKIIRSTIDFLYVKGNRLSAHKLPMIRPPSGTYYLTYNVTMRQLVLVAWVRVIYRISQELPIFGSFEFNVRKSL